MGDMAPGRDRDAEPTEQEPIQLLQESGVELDREDLDDKDSWEHGVWFLRRNQAR